MLSSAPALALIISVLIFLTTIFLVVKRWIGFSMTLLFLLFSLAAGIVIQYQPLLRHYLSSHDASLVPSSYEHQQLLQAIQHVELELRTEKKNLRHVMDQIQELFDLMDVQKQTLQNLLEESHALLKNPYSLPRSEAGSSPAPQASLPN